LYNSNNNIEGEGELVVEQVVNFVRGGYLSVTPVTGVPGTKNTLQTLTDADYITRTQGESSVFGGGK
jgi:hypothetical protein